MKPQYYKIVLKNLYDVQYFGSPPNIVSIERLNTEYLNFILEDHLWKELDASGFQGSLDKDGDGYYYINVNHNFIGYKRFSDIAKLVKQIARDEKLEKLLYE